MVWVQTSFQLVKCKNSNKPLKVSAQHNFQLRETRLGLRLPSVTTAKPRALGSLSTRVFETRTVTGNELFSLLTSPHTTTFTLLSIFSPLEMGSTKIWETILS